VIIARTELAADPATPEGVRTALAALERGETEIALEGLLEAATSSNGEVSCSVSAGAAGAVVSTRTTWAEV